MNKRVTVIVYLLIILFLSSFFVFNSLKKSNKTSDIMNISCTKILYNGENKIDIVLIPDNYSDQELWEDDVTIYNDFFFSVEPLKSNEEKFNIWRINDLNLEVIEINQYGQLTEDKKDIIRQISRGCISASADVIFLIKDNTHSKESYGQAFGGSIIALSRLRSSSDSEISVRTFIHEFGHAFGGLGDEYENQGNVFSKQIEYGGVEGPNIDTEGCPKWCSGALNKNAECYSQYIEFRNCLYNETYDLQNPENYNSEATECIYPSSAVECDLGTNCMAGTGCYWNSGSLTSFRSSKDSVMRYSQITFELNSISKTIIQEKINSMME